MANDIINAKSGPIKNGTLLIKSKYIKNIGTVSEKFENFNTYNKYVKNTPTITDMQSKFDNRFDDPSYYYGGGGGTDGGDVGNVLGV